MFDRIASDPDILGGKPVINSTYICVEFILELVASGGSVADIVMAYPFLTPADVRQAISFALGSIMPAVTTPNYSDPTRFSVRHYLVTPSPSGSWSMIEVLPGGEQDAGAFTANVTDVLKFREFADAAEMCQRLNAYYLPSSPPAVAAGQCVG